MNATRFCQAKPRGFTLIELLVVVAIIALLVSILLPSLSRARDTARISACAAQMRGIGTAAHMFAADNDDRLPLGHTHSGVSDNDRDGYVDSGTYWQSWFYSVHMNELLSSYGVKPETWVCPGKGTYRQELEDATASDNEGDGYLRWGGGSAPNAAGARYYSQQKHNELIVDPLVQRAGRKWLNNPQSAYPNSSRVPNLEPVWVKLINYDWMGGNGQVPKNLKQARHAVYSLRTKTAYDVTTEYPGSQQRTNYDSNPPLLVDNSTWDARLSQYYYNHGGSWTVEWEDQAKGIARKHNGSITVNSLRRDTSVVNKEPDLKAYNNSGNSWFFR